MPETRKLNLRLPPDLYEQARELAAYQCTSLNALAVAALRSWIEFQNRKPRPSSSVKARASASPKRSLPSEPPEGREIVVSEAWTVRRDAPKVGPNEPCPCGSGQKFKRCHGQPGRA